MEVGDPTAHVHINLAAGQQHLSELLPATLHARLHARHRDPRPSRRLPLRHPAERGPFDGGSIRLFEPADHAGQARREFGFRQPIAGFIRGGWKIDLQRISTTVPPLPRPEGIMNRVPRNLEQPRFGPIRFTEAPEVTDDAKKDVLEEVVGLDARRHTPR
jgi:hypothetical protein